jgi:hypothetical protein|tara:strand:+ start:609 stop:839 length:231 start_codon:yes stop_codon:yes gene_type:complete
MEDYTWTTEDALSTNENTMNDFIDNHLYEHCGEGYEVVYEDGTYVEIQDDNGTLYEVHASGNGDFCNHKVTFKELV